MSQLIFKPNKYLQNSNNSYNRGSSNKDSNRYIMLFTIKLIKISFINFHPRYLEDYKKGFYHHKNLKASF